MSNMLELVQGQMERFKITHGRLPNTDAEVQAIRGAAERAGALEWAGVDPELIDDGFDWKEA